MGKKYQPSGYQIISIDLNDKTSGTPFTPETEDEKLLYEILSSGEIKKPILLKIETNSYRFLGFANIDIGNNQLCLSYGQVGSSVSDIITAGSDELTWDHYEE